jgi:hypothetical protein
LDFLHPILLCRITYRAPLEMLLPCMKLKLLFPNSFFMIQVPLGEGTFLQGYPSLSIEPQHFKNIGKALQRV